MTLHQVEVDYSKYKLPEVVYHKGSYYLESSNTQSVEKRSNNG